MTANRKRHCGVPACAYDPDVAGQGLDQQLHAAGAAYVRAVRRLDAAVQAFDDSGTPMDPGPDPNTPYPWTRRQVQIMEETAAAFAEVIETRRAWDGLRRQAAGG